MKIISSLIVLFISFSVFAQKQVLDHTDYAKWNTIKGSMLSPDGKHVLYSLEQGEKDNFLKIKDILGN